MDEPVRLGGRFWLAMLGICVAAVVGGLIFFLIVGWAWYTWGFFMMLAVLSLGLIAFGWVYDRREQRRRNQLA